MANPTNVTPTKASQGKPDLGALGRLPRRTRVCLVGRDGRVLCDGSPPSEAVREENRTTVRASNIDRVTCKDCQAKLKASSAVQPDAD